MISKKYRFSSRFAYIFFSVLGIVGFVSLLCGFVFFILALKYKDCSGCSPTYTDISIVFITIGIGVVTIALALREKASKENDFAAEIRQNTSDALDIYHSVISNDEYIYIREILAKLYGEEKEAMVELKESYLDLENEERFLLSLERYSKKIVERAIGIISDKSCSVSEFNQFENYLHKYLLKYEEIAWKFNQRLIIEEEFYHSMYADINEFFLLSLAFIYSCAYENELMNLSLIPLLKRE